MQRCTVVAAVLALASADGRQEPPPHPAADSKPPTQKSLAAKVAEAWLPKGDRVGEWHSVGAGCPEDAPKVYVVSFRNSAVTFADAWTSFAGKCEIDKKYSENKLEITSGENKKGCWMLLERPGEDLARIESLFSLRTADYTVSVTLRPEDGGKALSGTLTVVVP
jgi:hypothetical protein